MKTNNLFTSISFEVTDSSGLVLTSKDLHLLRTHLQEALDEAAGNVLDQFGIVQENVHTILVEEIEVDNEDEGL